MNKDDDFDLRRREALRLLAQTGIRPSNYLPPALQLMWRLGLKVPPPHFISFGWTALVGGVYFSVAWGGLMALYFRFVSDLPLSGRALFIGALLAGLLFGLSTAAYYAHGRRKYALPAWQTLK